MGAALTSPHCLLAQIQEDVEHDMNGGNGYSDHQLAPKPDGWSFQGGVMHQDKLGSSHEGNEWWHGYPHMVGGEWTTNMCFQVCGCNLGYLIAKTTGSLIIEATYGKLKIWFPNLAWKLSSSITIFFYTPPPHQIKLVRSSEKKARVKNDPSSSYIPQMFFEISEYAQMIRTLDGKMGTTGNQFISTLN